MPLSAGTRLGPYEILSPLGAGGMGEVYRARDTRLDRTVAIKVLPAHLSLNPDLRARFEREAKAISGLQHAHICVLYDVGKEADVDFLVMEYLEGETLAARLARKPLALDETLRIAIEVAEALDTAHRHGVIHRDLKPGNIMLTKSGSKLMDFGLAKPHGLAASGSMPAFSAVATMTSPVSPITTAGTVVGTVQYMSPEQIQGQEADARSDLFALGATLYEMLAGKRAFEGKSQLSVASAILEKDPEPLSALKPVTPPALERLVRKCLAKDPEDRWQNARDLATELKWIAEGATQPVTPRAARARRREYLYAALAVVFLLAIVSAVSYRLLARAPVGTIVAEISPPNGVRFSFSGATGGPPVLSPDGRTLAFTGLDQSGTPALWVRSLDSASAHPLAGTEGADDPFWSADSRALGFFAGGKLKTVGLSASHPLVVADGPADAGGSWNREGTILFVPDYIKGVFKVAAKGGNPVLVAAMDASKYTFYQYPRFLPDGKHFLYAAHSGDPAIAGTYFASLDGEQSRLLVTGETGGIYASGYLLYLREGTLLAQAFDPARGQLKGDPQAVAERVAAASGAGLFDVSQNGTLIYQTGSSGTEKRMTWFDRTGKNLGVTGEVADYYDLRLSPDGQRLASNAAYPAGAPNSEIWVDELARGVHMRLTIDPATDHGIPVWSPDGGRIAFGALQGKAPRGIYQKPSNGAGSEVLLLASEGADTQLWPTSWSRDGKFILYTQGEIGLSRADIRILPMEGDRKPRVLVKAQAPASDGQFSPDGRWIAYTSHESGRNQVYVVPFDAAKVLNPISGSASAGGGGKWQVSASGGRCPRWRRDGKEIFFLTPASQMMAAQVEEKGNGIEVQSPQILFKSAVEAATFAPYDVTPDGKKFVIDAVKEQDTPLTLVVNWTASLKKQ
jgi:eukaryotic-like serine/threonine-protein kinase